jgi:hypothetical protein
MMSQGMGAVDTLRAMSEHLAATRDSLRLSQAINDAIQSAQQDPGLLWSMAGFFVGALGVLFAVGAIVAAFLIYQQGTEAKRQHAALIEEMRSDTADFLAVEKERSDRLNQAANEAIAKIQSFADPNSPEFQSALAAFSASLQVIRDVSAESGSPPSRKEVARLVRAKFGFIRVRCFMRNGKWEIRAKNRGPWIQLPLSELMLEARDVPRLGLKNFTNDELVQLAAPFFDPTGHGSKLPVEGSNIDGWTVEDNSSKI